MTLPPVPAGLTLSTRRWLLIIWLAYAFLPGVALGVAWLIAFAVLRSDPTRHPLALAILVGCALAVQLAVPVSTALLVGRWVLRPLAAIAAAARQIARGSLEYHVPTSQVGEIADVAMAFATMGTALRSSLERQAQLEEERRFFIGAVAHDLRSPLFALRGHLQGLTQGVATTPERQAQYLAICQAKTDEIDHLVADLFAYAQLDFPEFQPQHQEVDLATLIADMLTAHQAEIAAKQLNVTTTGPADVLIVGDPDLLRRAIANVLDNALRYTPARGRIHITWHATGPEILTIADSGPGIAPDDLPHIFDPLYRGEESRNRATGGAGLGLAIARRIARVHGWDLVASPAANAGGACFRFMRNPTSPEEKGVTYTAKATSHDAANARTSL